MSIIKTFYNNLTFKGIYENRQKGFFKAFLYLSLFTLFIYFPLAWDWVNKKTLNYDYYGITFVSNPPEDVLGSLPDCYLENKQFFCNEKANPLKYNGYDIYFLEGDGESDKYILFKEDTFVIHNNTSLEFVYSHTEKLSLNDLSSSGDISQQAKVIADILFISIKNNLIVPVLLGLYFILIVMNFIYLLLLSVISMSFKFRTTNFPSFKEILTMFMFSVTYPSFIALFTAIITKSFAFTPIIMNFMTPFIMYMVYRKNCKS